MNGLRVIRYRSGAGVLTYTVPALGVVLTLRGPLAAKVVTTLTWSPLSVVLAAGRAPSVPANWRWFRFAGIVFAAPRAWAVHREKWPDGCPYGQLTARSVQLSRTAVEAGVLSGLPCPFILPTARIEAGRPGVAVGTAMKTRAGHRQCFSLAGMRACQVSVQNVSSLLDLVVYPPGLARPDTVLIGLAGTGMTARTILDSVRPAAGPR